MPGSVHAGQAKFSGTAAGYLAYLDEQTIGFEDSADRAASYYATPKDGVVFAHVRGKAAAHLPGLDISRGLTREQHARLHNGQWDEVNQVAPGHRKVWEVDSQGREVKLENPETGRFEKIPVIDPATGKQKTETVHIAGYDRSWGFDKSVAEFLVEHPEYVPLFEELALEATDNVMSAVVEPTCKLVKRTCKRPSEMSGRTTKMQGSMSERVVSDGLVWSSVVQHGARPTPESIARGYGADPHFHVHTFVYSMARLDGGWKSIEGRELFLDAEIHGEAVSMEFARLLEEHGFPIEYEKPDRKGVTRWHLAGSTEEVRRFLSTNAERAWKIQMKHERDTGKTMSKVELQREMQRTKGRKTKAAKLADEGGREYFAKVRDALTRAGLAVNMPLPAEPIQRASFDERKAKLFAKLELPEGVVRDCDVDSHFDGKAILPAAVRAGVGLGFSADEVAQLVDEYRTNELEIVIDDKGALKYTTKTVLGLEREIAEDWEQQNARRIEAVPEEIIVAYLAEREEAGKKFHVKQEEALRAGCSSAPVVHIGGPAGTGKNDVLEGIFECKRRAGLVGEVIAGAVAAKRGREVGEAISAERSGSIRSLTCQRDKFVRDLKTGEPVLNSKGRSVRKRDYWVPSSRDVAVLDEAPLANTFDMAEFLTATKGVGQIITVGDERQDTAIGIAGHYREELDKRPPVELEKVFRHTDDADREAIAMIREGKSHAALADLAERGRVHVAEDHQSLASVVMDRVKLHRDSGRGADEVTIVFQGANIELDALNRFVQRDRIARKEIGCDDDGNLDPARRFKVQEQATGRRWMLFEGDQVIFNEGVYAGLDHPIRNGTTGRILQLSSEGRCRVRLDGKERRTVTVYLDESALVQPVAPAYAVSTPKMQGDQVAVDIVVPGSPNTASLNSGYSQSSRAVDHVDIVMDRETWGQDPCRTLGVAWSRTSEKHSASSYLRSLGDEDEISQDPLEWDLYEEDGTLFAAAPDPLIRQQEWEDDVTPERASVKQIDRLRQTLDQGISRGIGW